MPYVPRDLEDVLRDVARRYPVVTLTGPRQSGKTTLARGVFGDLAYVSLEPLDTRDFAVEDPRGFLEEYRDGAVIDEVQRAPDLLAYLQEAVDEDPTPGRFILTGSQHLGLLESVSQSLAGRTAVLHLLPLSLGELDRFPEPPEGLLEVLWSGGYPRIHDRGIPADRWLSDYVTTYVQRDVRQVLNVGDLEAFSAFVRLCAGRTACELNLSSLGADAGISHSTARSWLSVLETGFLCFRLPAWQRSARKQVVKSPKLHFFDTGLVCHLLGITEPEQLRHHPLRGQIFETWVGTEIYKARVHRGAEPRLFHFRDAKGLEVDLVLQLASRLLAVEAKSGATVVSDFFKPLQHFAENVSAEPEVQGRIVHGGEGRQNRGSTLAVGWREIHDLDWA